jgi:hypothetical protein
MIGDLPAFGIVSSFANGLAQDGAEAAATPEVALEDGLKREWVKWLHIS